MNKVVWLKAPIIVKWCGHYKQVIWPKASIMVKWCGRVKLTGCNKGIFIWKLSSNIRSRLRIELTRITNSTTTEDSFLYRLVMQFKISYLALRMTTETAINIHLCVMRICKHILLSTFYMELNIKDGVKLNGIIEKHFSKTELSKNSPSYVELNDSSFYTSVQ
jgi:hypothetical protein